MGRCCGLKRWLQTSCLLRQVVVRGRGVFLTLFVDNQSAISVANNPEHHGRMKHLDLRFYWLRDMVELGSIRVKHLRTEDMPADLLTKPLGRLKVNNLRHMLGLQQ